MKSRMLSPMLMLLWGMEVYGSVQMIVCGNEPREIYFIGIHPTRNGYPVLYYSPNGGEDLEMRDTTDIEFSFYGSLMADAADSTFYRVISHWDPYPGQLVSTDGGRNWVFVDSAEFTTAYAAGVIPGEVYRRLHLPPWYSRLERSEAYGAGYSACTCSGYPDSLTVYSLALGVDSGEVYIWGSFGNLYYSENYAEDFVFLGDLYTTWGINPWTDIVNGAEPGEIYVLDYDPKIIWRVTHFGADAEIIADFPPMYTFWAGGIATTSQPGELYFLAEDAGGEPGGPMHIYHTTDYFQTYTLYEHNIEPNGVGQGTELHPPAIGDLRVFPNPANEALNISYEIAISGNVEIIMFNIIGQEVWSKEMGAQPPGEYLYLYSANRLTSGVYLLQLRTRKSNVTKIFTILK